MKRLLFLLTLFVVLGMQAQQHVMTVDVSKPTARINPAMYGIFFEDINFGADGGLYAELVKNRSFEFPQPLVGWIPFGEVTVQDERPCFDRNPHYVRITNDGCLLRAGLDNEGYRGIGLKKGEDYRFSAYVRTPDTKPMKLSVELVNSNGENLLKKELEVKGSEWQKLTAVLKAPFTDVRSRLRVVLQTEGTVDMDHISLFPVNTWKKRENGLRADLVQALYDLNPGVFRFPGGCIIEGNSLATRYQWKNSVGPVENRPLNENRWNYTFKHKAFPDYFQSYGLGFYEYFLLSEDLGAEPLPVLSCGLSCQYESNEVVPLGELGPYVQDALDLIEFANGAATSKWGKVRADMGHPEPFGLKMIAIGNEQWGEVYPERLEVFTKAIRAEYPDMQIVGSSGPSADGDKFDYLWPEMKRIGVDLVDEHYYMAPDWFFANAARYDDYDRKGPKVFAGEYASHDHPTGKANNFLAALGFYEYFLLSEDLGAEPLPVLSCGLSCQYESNEVVPLGELGPYVQDALDLIEFANGAATSKWGKVRADMGHPEPFGLKMIAIGNEQWGEVYPERLEVFTKAIRAEYPDMQIVGSSGPSADGDKFDYLWPEMKRIGVDLVDEHYYMAPDWFFANAARYDDYDRKGPKVFAGEYASHDHPTGKANNFLAALSEAAFMTGLERNADVVHLATYAPLFAHVDAWQWNPDLIWFDNLRMMRTPNYYVQQMYGMNAGTDVLNLQMDGKPVTGQDSLYASAVLDAPTGEVILKLVNAGSRSEKVQIEFSGLKKRQLVSGSCTYLQSDDWKAKNTLEQEAIVPRIRPVEVASRSLSLELQPRSFGVYRLRISTQSK